MYTFELISFVGLHLFTFCEYLHHCWASSARWSSVSRMTTTCCPQASYSSRMSELTLNLKTWVPVFCNNCLRNPKFLFQNRSWNFWCALVLGCEESKLMHSGLISVVMFWWRLHKNMLFVIQMQGCFNFLKS